MSELNILLTLYFSNSRYNLGKVLEAIGDSEAATDCMATALEVENNSPILPYMSIAVTFD